jgi:hypothetical protein
VSDARGSVRPGQVEALRALAESASIDSRLLLKFGGIVLHYSSEGLERGVGPIPCTHGTLPGSASGSPYSVLHVYSHTAKKPSYSLLKRGMTSALPFSASR